MADGDRISQTLFQDPTVQTVVMAAIVAPTLRDLLVRLVVLLSAIDHPAIRARSPIVTIGSSLVAPVLVHG